MRTDWLVRGIMYGALACGVAAKAAAQEPAHPASHNMPADVRGILAGAVRNADATTAAGVAVVAANANTTARFTAVTDAQGRYVFAALPVGTYDITVEAAGLTLFRRTGVDVAADRSVDVSIALNPLGASQLGDTERQTLFERIATLEQRINDLESSAVLSEPETRVRRIEVYVDENGNVHDEPAQGATPRVTYQRERVYRRQTINEKLTQALDDAASRSVRVGVDAAIATQVARQTRGDAGEAGGHAYQLASADLFFTAGLAQNTLFFADIVGLSGAPPDAEIRSMTLLNGYTARLVRQNELNLREAWLRTELFSQRLALTAGRLDLTNYFDQNALANDESTQFISDALVNNQMLGLAVNGTGLAAEYDAKTGFRLKFGLQQSNTDATNLSNSMYTLSEVGYTFTPFALPEGTYRGWFRTDNTAPDLRRAAGVSADQKLTAIVGLFGRYGTQEVDGGDRDTFYAAGVGFQSGLIFSPQDTWGVGYAQVARASGPNEKLAEGYYNFHLTDKLRLSLHLQHVLEGPGAGNRFGYLLPGVRLQAAF
ncbi:MAG: carboxypeptidase regulatory-like domain-containing protein [Acidobacteria bacterium]|nr:carboxypeptidase regulatory-like domain-containing protein [Acidobacteriota bacterium]